MRRAGDDTVNLGRRFRGVRLPGAPRALFVFTLRSPAPRIGYNEPMNQPIFTFNALDAGLGAALAGLALVVAVMVTIAILATRAMRRQSEESARIATAQARQNEAMERRLAELSRIQSETAGWL